MLKEKHLKLCYELEPNELKTIKTGWGWGGGGSGGVQIVAHSRTHARADPRVHQR